MGETREPELEMVRRVLRPGALAAPTAFAAGYLAGGPGVAASAAAGIVVVIANFAAHGLSLSWASRISISMVQAVALAGFVVRLGVIVGVMFALNTMGWFSPLAFGLAVVPGTILLLVFEARLALRGLGGELQIPADPAAVRAAEHLAAKEA